MTKRRAPAQAPFTLREMVVIYSSLLASKQLIERDSHKIIKENGRDVYDSVKSDHITALEKIEALVAQFRAQKKAENNAEPE